MDIDECETKGKRKQKEGNMTCMLFTVSYLTYQACLHIECYTWKQIYWISVELSSVFTPMQQQQDHQQQISLNPKLVVVRFSFAIQLC